MFFRGIKHTRRSFPPQWKEILSRDVRFYRKLSVEDKDTFEQMILNFLDKVSITGIETEIDDKDKLLVACSGVIPLFEFPSWEYRNLNEVLLYDTSFNQEYETRGGDRNILGMVGSGAMNRMMILSKPALYQGFKNTNSKSNVGIKEGRKSMEKEEGEGEGGKEGRREKKEGRKGGKRRKEERRERKEG
ncbi:MAG: hypothetical protein DWQ02_08305, partial [Bacteroidetes bacterium]